MSNKTSRMLQIIYLTKKLSTIDSNDIMSRHCAQEISTIWEGYDWPADAYASWKIGWECQLSGDFSKMENYARESLKEL